MCVTVNVMCCGVSPYHVMVDEQGNNQRQNKAATPPAAKRTSRIRMGQVMRRWHVMGGQRKSVAPHDACGYAHRTVVPSGMPNAAQTSAGTGVAMEHSPSNKQ